MAPKSILVFGGKYSEKSYMNMNQRFFDKFRSPISIFWRKFHSSSRVKLTTGYLLHFTLATLRPFCWVRVGILHGEAIGGLISQADLILALRALNVARQRNSSLDIFIVPTQRANQYLAEKYILELRKQRRTLVLDARKNPFVRLLGKAFRGLEFLAIQHPELRNHFCGSPLWEGIEGCGFVEDGRPWINIDPNEYQESWRTLAGIGIYPTQKIICFGVRDSTYWARSRDEKVWGSCDDGGGSTQDFRNSSMGDYLLALSWAVDQGFTLVRMGAGAAIFPELDELGVIDYANSPIRSDALDLMLFSVCHSAFFGGAFGMNQLALAFRKPVCVVNFRPFMFTSWSTNPCLLVPSLLEEVDTGKILSVEKMLEYPFHVARLYEKAGVRFVPNTQEEIRQSLMEMVSRVDGTWEESGNQAELQDYFWQEVNRFQRDYALYARSNDTFSKVHSRFSIADLQVTPVRSTLGSFFLREHSQELFGL